MIRYVIPVAISAALMVAAACSKEDVAAAGKSLDDGVQKVKNLDMSALENLDVSKLKDMDMSGLKSMADKAKALLAEQEDKVEGLKEKLAGFDASQMLEEEGKALKEKVATATAELAKIKEKVMAFTAELANRNK